MAEKSPQEKLALTLHLSADVAKRLMAAAETRKRTPADVAAELLDRHLPRAQSGQPKKGTIPYS